MTPGAGSFALTCCCSIPLQRCSRSAETISAFGSLKYWHQHPAGSPRVPNTVRTSCQGASATDTTLTSVALGMPSRYPPPVEPVEARFPPERPRRPRHPFGGGKLFELSPVGFVR